MLQTLFTQSDPHLREYITHKKQPEEAFMKNYLVYFDIMREKELVIKNLLRARQMKRAVIMLLSK